MRSAQTGSQYILQTAVPSPLNRIFDYLPPAGCDASTLKPGMRLRIPFGRSSRIGLIMAIADTSSVEPEKLKAALDIIDDEPLLPDSLLTLLDWAIRYYHHAPGNVISNALPTLLRQGQAARPTQRVRWHLTSVGRRIDPDSVKRAPRQRDLLQRLAQHNDGATAETLQTLANWRATLKTLTDKGWVERQETDTAITTNASRTTAKQTLALNPAQQQAVDTVSGSLDRFAAFLLEGVTGSGKTEVYFRIIEQVLAASRQALLLVPEIGLTP